MKNFKRAMSCAMAVAMALSCAAVPAFAAEDRTEPNPVIEAHPDDGMSPTKVVTPIGQKTFYKISGDRVIYTDRDDGTGWEAVPSQYIKGSEYNVGNVDYGIYATSDGEVHFVALSDCHDEGNGTYTWYHGTSDSATVSEDVDKATNTDPTMGTQFYLNIENGIDPDGTTEEDKVEAGTADERVDYEITVGTKTTYQLNATVPMYVCMYGFRGTGNVVTPDSDAYRLKNMSTINRASSASILDIVKVTHMAKIYDENHSDETLYSIAYDEETGSYTYWYSNPAFTATGKPNVDWQEPENYLVIEDKNINASGECYVIFIDGEWTFKAAGVLDDDAFRETVDAIDPSHPLSEDFIHNGFNFGKEFSVGAVSNESEQSVDEGLALKVTELQAEPATWRLKPVSTSVSALKRGELAMSIAPKTAISNASAIDLSQCSGKMDITENGWFLDAPKTVEKDGSVKPENATTLPVITKAQMAGGNVNDAGCTSVVKVNYTLTPVFQTGDGETSTDIGNVVESNREVAE